MLIPPSDALAALGVNPEDQPAVVVTHAHGEHIGNLAHSSRPPIVVARAEVDFWASPYGRRAQFTCWSRARRFGPGGSSDWTRL
jgi:glyoxylase-like metal-dependent hydrolase (beta-lactamase superfamily II)